MTQIISNSELLKFKSKILDNTYNEGIINAKIAVLLKYLSNFWRTLEMSLISYDSDRETIFAISDAKNLCSCCNFIHSR